MIFASVWLFFTLFSAGYGVAPDEVNLVEEQIEPFKTYAGNTLTVDGPKMFDGDTSTTTTTCAAWSPKNPPNNDESVNSMTAIFASGAVPLSSIVFVSNGEAADSNAVYPTYSVVDASGTADSTGTVSSLPLTSREYKLSRTPTSNAVLRLELQQGAQVKNDDRSHWNLCEVEFYTWKCPNTGQRQRYVPSGSTGDCQVCPDGHRCNTELITWKMSFEDCGGIGVYCIAGEQFVVNSGWYSTPLDAPEAQRTGQAPCEAGYKCSGGRRSECGSDLKAGSSSEIEGASVFCENGLKYQVQTAFYSTPENVSSTTRTGEAPCGDGYECVGGIRTACVAELMPLHYCKAGLKYELAPGDMQVVDSIDGMELAVGSQSCSAGFICDQDGSRACGGVQFYCFENANNTVPIGYFSGPLSAAEDKRWESIPCSAGYFCDGSGRRQACPAGRYQSSEGAVSADCEGLCSPGWICPSGSTSSQPPGQECNRVGEYCPNEVQGQTYVAADPGFYTADASDTPTAFAASQQLPCSPGSYCLNGQQFACPPGTYGASSQLASANCTGPCDAGYLCPAGQTVATPVNYQCPAGHFCLQGASIATPCPAGRYSSVLGLQSANQCQECLPGEYSPAPGATSCLVCSNGTYSTAGRARCTPSISSIVVRDDPPVDPGVSSNDVVIVTFSAATNRAPTFEATLGSADVYSLFSFPPGFSEPDIKLSGSWSTDRKTLEIVVPSAADSIDDAAFRVGSLFNMTILESAGLRDAENLSAPLSPDMQPEITPTGTWGDPSKPEASVAIASDTGGNAGLRDGDSIFIYFNQIVSTPATLPAPYVGAGPQESDQRIRAMFGANVPLGTLVEEFRGVWADDMASIQLEIVRVNKSHPLWGTVGWELATSPDLLQIHILASADIRDRAGVSEPCNGSVEVIGSWGEAPARIAVAPHSQHSLWLEVEALRGSAPSIPNIDGVERVFPTNTIVEWCDNPAFQYIDRSGGLMSCDNITHYLLTTILEALVGQLSLSLLNFSVFLL